MGIYERKAAFERNPPAVRERALVRFSGVDGFDVYNCSAPFVFRGRRGFGRIVPVRRDFAILPIWTIRPPDHQTI